MVEVVEVLLLVGAVAREGQVLQDEHVVLRVELAEVAPGWVCQPSMIASNQKTKINESTSTIELTSKIKIVIKILMIPLSINIIANCSVQFPEIVFENIDYSSSEKSL